MQNTKTLQHAFIIFALLLFTNTACALLSSAEARTSDEIVAVVNDDIITKKDLNDRLMMVIRSSNLPDTAEFKQRITPQVMDALIQETIQLQEARALNIEIENERINEGFIVIAQQNNIEPEHFKKILQAQRISIETMARQIQAQIAWGEVVQSKIRPQVNISDQDVDAYIEHLQSRAGQMEYNIAEIFLSATTPQDYAQKKALGQKLRAQIQKNAPFQALARQFSNSASAAQGGHLGWVSTNTMDANIAALLPRLEAGQTSPVIEAADGIYLIKILAKRKVNVANPDDIVYTLQMISLPTTREQGSTQDDAAAFLGEVNGCFDLKSKLEPWANATIEEKNLRGADLAALGLRDVPELDIGQITTPEKETQEKRETLSAAMLCRKTMPEGELPDREQITRKIGTERMDILQKSYLRDLKSQAYIETRL